MIVQQVVMHGVEAQCNQHTYIIHIGHTAQGMVKQSATLTGKIGLIASYEFLYAAESSCWTTSGYDYSGGCYQKDWLFSTVTNSGSSAAWALSSYSGHSFSALTVYSFGRVDYYAVHLSFDASPVVYLKSTVTITGGNGGSG